MTKIEVLIVDDHGVVRQGLRTYLELLDDIEVIGEAENGLEAMAQVRQHQPDVVLMDLVMPEMDGIEATRQVSAISPSTRVIVLTSFADDEKVFPAIKAGATGYLLKDVSPGDLANAIRAVHAGETHLHPDITKKLVDQLASPRSDPRPTPDELTPRELEVLRLIAQGKSNREIARALAISDKTVKTHVSNILSKLHLADRTQAAIFAHRHGVAPE
ncbi:response regulator [Chloroflexota bacterium]|jgi:NarL family two-component system response regulator LiaR